MANKRSITDYFIKLQRPSTSDNCTHEQHSVQPSPHLHCTSSSDASFTTSAPAPSSPSTSIGLQIEFENPQSPSDSLSVTVSDLSPPKKKRKVGEYRDQHVWLTGDNYCLYCKTFYSNRPIPKGSDGTFINKPFTNFKKATGISSKHNKLLKHEEAGSHKKAKAFHSAKNQSLRQGTVFNQLHVASESEKEENIQRLMDYAKAVYWLTKEEIPYTTKYNSLLDLCYELDGSQRMQMWNESRPGNASYRSHDIPGEFLKAIKEHLIARTLNPGGSVSYFAVMADEATDLQRRTVLSVCVRVLNLKGEPVETFIGLRELESTEAVTVTEGILSVLEKRGISLKNVLWLSFDGANNMAGKDNGTQALMIKNHTQEAVYIHCRSHALQLVCVQAAKMYPDIKKMFSVLNSLWRLLYNSPKNLRKFKAIQDLLDGPDIELIRAGDTRWTSHYLCVASTTKCLESIIVTLQQIHADGADLSSEAGGLLLTLQTSRGITLLFALKRILQPLSVLSKQLQSPSSTLVKMDEFLSTALYTLNELIENPNLYQNDSQQFIQSTSTALINENPITPATMHSKIVKPFIMCLLQNFASRFSGQVMAMCSATSLFDPSAICLSEYINQFLVVKPLLTAY
jgi:hypothetical protein